MPSAPATSGTRITAASEHPKADSGNTVADLDAVRDGFLPQLPADPVAAGSPEDSHLRKARSGETPHEPAVIEVRTTGANTTVLATYRDFVLTSAAHQDMERLDVAETFGAPQVQTTGRMVRKCMFRGVLRTSLTLATRGRAPIATQADAFQSFYDSYLRATALARLGAVAVITVGGRIYTGVGASQSVERSSDNDNLETVGFDFLATKVEQSRTNLPNDVFSAAQTQIKVVQQVRAHATKADALADFKVGLAGPVDAAAVFNLASGKLTAKVLSLSGSVSVDPGAGTITPSWGGPVLRAKINTPPEIADWVLNLVYTGTGAPVDGASAQAGPHAARLQATPGRVPALGEYPVTVVVFPADNPAATAQGTGVFRIRVQSPAAFTAKLLSRTLVDSDGVEHANSLPAGKTLASIKIRCGGLPDEVASAPGAVSAQLAYDGKQAFFSGTAATHETALSGTVSSNVDKAARTVEFVISSGFGASVPGDAFSRIQLALTLGLPALFSAPAKLASADGLLTLYDVPLLTVTSVQYNGAFGAPPKTAIILSLAATTITDPAAYFKAATFSTLNFTAVTVLPVVAAIMTGDRVSVVLDGAVQRGSPLTISGDGIAKKTITL